MSDAPWLMGAVTQRRVRAPRPPRVVPTEPRGKGGKQTGPGDSPGKRKIPPGVTAAVQALALDGTLKQAEIARCMGVSKDYVMRLAHTVTGLSDPALMTAIKRRLPDLYRTVAAGAGVRALAAIDADRPGDATKWTFAGKLATETTRWTDPAAETGTTLSEFIRALNQAGGGALTVNGPSGPQPGETPDPTDVIEATLVVEDPPEPGEAMTTRAE